MLAETPKGKQELQSILPQVHPTTLHQQQNSCHAHNVGIYFQLEEMARGQKEEVVVEEKAVHTAKRVITWIP